MLQRTLRPVLLSVAVVAAFAAEVRVSPERGGLEVALVRNAHAINTWFRMSGWKLTLMDCTVDVGGACLLSRNGSCRNQWFACLRDKVAKAEREAQIAIGNAARELEIKMEKAIARAARSVRDAERDTQIAIGKAAGEAEKKMEKAIARTAQSIREMVMKAVDEAKKMCRGQR